MDLQHLASGIANTPSVFDAARRLYADAASIEVVKSEQDIDSLAKLMAMNGMPDLTHPMRINVDSMLSQVNVTKRYVDYSKEDDFV